MTSRVNNKLIIKESGIFPCPAFTAIERRGGGEETPLKEMRKRNVREMK